MMGFLTRSIPRRILASLIGIYIATYVATSLVVYSGARTSILESNTAALDQLADLKYEQLDNTVETLATNLTAWSELEIMNDLVSGDVDKRVAQTLEGLKRLYNLTGDIYAFDATGKLLASSHAGNIGGMADRIPPEWQTQADHLVLIDKKMDPMTEKETIALVIPVFASFNKKYRIGTLVTTYPWATLEKQLFSLESGTILVDKNDPTKILASDRGGLNQIHAEDGGTSSGFVVGRSVSRSGLIGNWQVVTVQDTGIVFAPLRRIILELVLLGVLLGIPIAVLGRWLSQKLTAPIAELTRAAQGIADTDKLDTRVPISSSDELGMLARSFNRMTDNLERTSREREQFVQELAALNQTLEAKIAARTEELETTMKAQQNLIRDISHEIKSPLARLSVALGLARRAVGPHTPKQFDRMEKEIENISALASELLTLARLGGTAALLEFTQIDLRDLVEQVVADAVYEAPHRTSDVKLQNPGDRITVAGNADLLRRAIENVVRNAIFYTAEKTPIEIVLRRKTPGVVSIEVRDHGPGVPKAALGHLFEPFYRVDEARARDTGGTGIGLAICQRAVQLHGGSVHAAANEPNGLIVEIELPSMPPSS